MLRRYADVRCVDCGRGCTWIEIAFGHGPQLCGACLKKRVEEFEQQQETQFRDSVENLINPE